MFIEQAELRWAHDEGCGDDSIADPMDSRLLATGGYTHQGKGGPPGCEHGGRTYRSDENTRPRGPAELGAEGFYLKADEGVRGGTGTAAPTYWQYYKGAYIYWFFYPYNDAPSIPAGPAAVNMFDHEGDWERIAVRTDGEGARVGVTLWGHGKSCYLRDDQLEWVNDHPMVYSAKGTHASYADDGVHRHGVDRTSAGTPWETWQRVRPIADEPWYGYWGAWGSVGTPGPWANHRTGPAGPHPNREPTDAWTEHHCTEPDQSVPQDEPAGPTIPDAFLDQWYAPEPMSRPGPPWPYYVRLQLWGEDVPGADGFEGLSSYSEDFNATPGIGALACSNDLDLVEASADKLVFAETEDDDVYENCPDKGTVTLTLSGDQLVYDYVGDSGSAHTVLVRS
ncbi:Vps62-related protein [Amycolatopsis sp. YIM 10]|uniref:Vps62-related protein n=1 Tax=Amycolatopsis sp. YIM 10 TaxID=2653857 RepID=UPI0018848AFF|nr:Vps62-related protein [Amycolatopsis sp. YIM 10]